MTPPSPLFPCTCLGYLLPGPHGIACHKPTHRHPHLARAHRPVIANEAGALSSLTPIFWQPAPKALAPLLIPHVPQNIFFCGASIPLQYIVSRHIPRTRPSGVTIYLSSRPNTGDHSVSGGHA